MRRGILDCQHSNVSLVYFVEETRYQEMMGWICALRLRVILFDQSRRRLCHFTHVVQAEQEEKESTWDLMYMGNLIINPAFVDSLNPNHKEGEGIGMVYGSQGLRVYHSRWNLYEHQPIPVYMSFSFESCWLNLDVIRVKFDMEFIHVRSGPAMCRMCTLFPRRLQVLRKLRDDQEDLLMKLELSDDFSHTVVIFRSSLPHFSLHFPIGQTRHFGRNNSSYKGPHKQLHLHHSVWTAVVAIKQSPLALCNDHGIRWFWQRITCDNITVFLPLTSAVQSTYQFWSRHGILRALWVHAQMHSTDWRGVTVESWGKMRKRCWSKRKLHHLEVGPPRKV